MFVEEDGNRRREALKWVSFDDCHNNVSGYATGWYFLVHSSFKPALDIFHVERIHAERTRELRNKISLELTGLSHEDFKERITAGGGKFTETPEHEEIMKHSCKVIFETQGGSPMLFSFRAADGLESRNGEWYVQVESAVAATSGSPGDVCFVLYERTRKPDSKLAWSWLRQICTTQEDFVALLRTGRCETVDLLDMRQLQLI